MLDMISVLIDCTTAGYVVAQATHTVLRVLGKTPPPIATALYYELKPFILVFVVGSFYVIPAMQHEPITWSHHLGALVWAINWWLSRNDKDDRWKKRRTHATEAVARVGARLTVIPAGANA